MKRWLLVMSLTLLSACSSAPVMVQYYLLDEPSVNGQFVNIQNETSDEVIQISLEKLVLAKYLRQNKLAILEGNQLYFANQHLWAEELEQGIASALAQDINRHDQAQLLLSNEPSHGKTDYSVQLKINHLVATQNNTVILQGHFWILNDKQVIKDEAINLSLDIEQAGFSHSVKQQRALVRLLAQRLEAALISL